jgi:hypothetical protein
MYSLTLNFKTKEELIDFLHGEAEAKITETSEVAAPAKAKATRTTKAKADPLANVVIPEAPSVPTQTQQMFATNAPLSNEATFNRNIVLTNISSTVNELKMQNVPEASIATLFMNVFVKMGVTGSKISELPDNILAVFNTHFYPEVQSLKASVAPQQPTAGSFI